MKTSVHPKILALLGARTLGLFKVSRYLTRSKLRILCYHGGAIGDESQFNPKLFCSAKTLDTRMQWMKAHGFQFVTLEDGVKDGSCPSVKAPLRTVVTFDDGWYSTAQELLPVLFKLQIPSTLYLSTDSFLRGWPIFNVVVRYTIWKAGQRSVTINGWGSEIDGEYDLRNSRDRYRLSGGVVAAIAASSSSRDEVYAALNRFAEDLGLDATTLQLDSRRFDYVTKEELLEIAKQGCSIELHGHNHSYPKDKPAQFAKDLRLCANTIVEMGLPEPRHYCYPSGSFDAQATITLTALGVVSATTCVPGLTNQVDDEHRHYLPRFLDGEDVHHLEFESEMSGFSELIRSATRLFKQRPSLKLDLTNPSESKHEIAM